MNKQQLLNDVYNLMANRLAHGVYIDKETQKEIKEELKELLVEALK